MLTNSVCFLDIKPELCEYLRKAQFMLDPEKVPDENIVHDVRVLMKKSRAALKLLKSQTETELFEKEYAALRDVGRRMQTWRETSVHRKLLKAMKKKYPELFSDLAGNEKINRFLNKTEEIISPPPEMKKNVEGIIDILHKSGYRMRFRNLNNLDLDLLFKELETTFRNNSEIFLKARNYPKSTNLHEFRKQIKDFLYQLAFFRALKPKVIKGLEKRLDSMAQNLGKYNDIAMLVKELGYRYKPGENTFALDELILILKKEQDRYLSKVWPSAFNIFHPGHNLLNVLGIKVLVIK